MANQDIETHRLALSEALNLGSGAPWEAIHERAQELSRECTASTVHGGRPAVEEAYPSHSSWLVELLMADGHWASAFHAHDREAAIDRLHHRRKYAPHREWRLVELRETYTVEETP